MKLVEYDFSGIVIPEGIESRMQEIGLAAVATGEMPLGPAEASPYLAALYRRLKEACAELATEIELELHSRLAFGVSCVALVLLGAALGIVFRSGHLLTAFGVSFIPAALCLITIFTGKHIAEKSSISMGAGIVFLWSGILAVALADIIIYRALLRR